jgi:hypothetical protein
MIAALLGAAMFACGDDDNAAPPPSCPDAGSTAPDAGPVDAGPPLPVRGTPFDASTSQPTNVHLLGGADAELFVGVTTGPTPHAVYWAYRSETEHVLRAIPVTGGAPIDLDTVPAVGGFDGATAFVRNGAVSWYLSADAQNFITDVRYWTPAAGVKKITTPSRALQFNATIDGTRVAFPTDANSTSSNYAVVPADNPDITSVALSGPNAINTTTVNAVGGCNPLFQFVGDTLIGAYCTGTDPNAIRPRLVKVATTGAPVVLIDNTLPADDFDSLNWQLASDLSAAYLGDRPNVDETFATTGRVVVFDTAGVKSTTPLTKVGFGSRFTPDHAYFVTDGDELQTVKLADNPPTTTAVSPTAARIGALSPDGKVVYYVTGALSGNVTKLDLGAAVLKPDTLAVGTYVVMAVTPSGANLVIEQQTTAAGAPSTSTDPLFTLPVAGGVPLAAGSVTAALGVSVVQGSETVLVDTGFSFLGAGLAARIAFSTFDAAKGGPPALAVSALFDLDDVTANAVSGKRYIYRDIGTNPGIYALDLP